MKKRSTISWVRVCGEEKKLLSWERDTRYPRCYRILCTISDHSGYGGEAFGR